MAYGRRGAAIGKQDPTAMTVTFHFCAKFFLVNVVGRADAAVSLGFDARQRQSPEGS
jgi:hypothetical protein